MAADLARTPATGIRMQACGDAHLANFGSYATPEGLPASAAGPEVARQNIVPIATLAASASASVLTSIRPQHPPQKSGQTPVLGYYTAWIHLQTIGAAADRAARRVRLAV